MGRGFIPFPTPPWINPPSPRFAEGKKGWEDIYESWNMFLKTNTKAIRNVTQIQDNFLLDGLFQVPSGKTRGLTTQKGAQGSQKERNGALGVPFGVQNVSLGSPWGGLGLQNGGPGCSWGALGEPLGAQRGTFGTRLNGDSTKTPFLTSFWLHFWSKLRHFTVIFEVVFWVCFLTQFWDRFRVKNIIFIICLKCRPCVSYGNYHMFDKLYLVMSCLVLLSCLVLCGKKVCRKVTKKCSKMYEKCSKSVKEKCVCKKIGRTQIFLTQTHH